MARLPQMALHTRMKHELLKRYLDRWFPILGSAHRRINYIDGFAGPGEYDGGEPGSPLLAIDAAKKHVEKGTLGSNVEINFIFIEAKKARANHLRKQLSLLAIPSQFNVFVEQGQFSRTIGGFLDELKESKERLAPTFAFVDPLGFSGIPFKLMAQILAYPRCEVYINIMVDFINRFLEHPDQQVVAHFPQTFGTDEMLKIPGQPGDRVAALLELYQKQLKSKARFVGRFDMLGKSNHLIYSLFFASNSAKGFEKMKEANWSVDMWSGGRFSDFEPGHAYLSSFLPELMLREDVQERFRNQRVAIEEVRQFVIEETSFLPKHLTRVLNQAEDAGEITVEARPGVKRRKGTFPDGKVFIVFRP